MARPRPPVPAPLYWESWELNQLRSFGSVLSDAQEMILSPGLDGELVGLVGDAAFQSGTVHADPGRIAAFGDGDPEGTLGHRRAVVAHLHTVRT